MSCVRPASTALRLLGVGGALVGTIVALLHVEGGLLPWPRTLAEAAGDIRQTDPLVVAFSLGRGLAIGLCGYVLLTTVLGLLARLAGLRRAVGLLDACSPEVVRRLLRGVATLGAVATLGTALGNPAFALGAASDPTSTTTTAPDRPPVLHRLPDDTGPASSDPVAPPLPVDPTTTTTATPTVPPAADPPPTTTPPAGAPVARARLHELDDPPPPPRPPPPLAAPDPPSTPTSPPTPAVPTPSTQPAVPGPASSAAVAPEWVIAPGDHLWHVSVTTLTSAWGRPPTDAETVTYLHALIERNQAVFAVPGHPDLVFPGQRFALPVP